MSTLIGSQGGTARTRVEELQGALEIPEGVLQSWCGKTPWHRGIKPEILWMMCVLKSKDLHDIGGLS